MATPASNAAAAKPAANTASDNLPLSPASKDVSAIMSTPLQGRVVPLSEQLKEALSHFDMGDPSSIAPFTALMDSLTLLPEDVRNAALAECAASKVDKKN